MSARDKWVWGQVLSRACCVLERAVAGDASGILLCSGILREVLTKTSIDFSMSGITLKVFLDPPALLWMHSHMWTLEVMYVRSELRLWVSANPKVCKQCEFCIITVTTIYFSPSQVQLHLPHPVPLITPQHFLPRVVLCLLIIALGKFGLSWRNAGYSISWMVLSEVMPHEVLWCAM